MSGSGCRPAQSRLPRPYMTLNIRRSSFVRLALYGNMNGSRFSARRVTSSDWTLVYLRIPFAPWRVPRPEAFQPPIGRLSAV